MRPRLITSILIAIAVSVVTSKIIYFGFTPNYGTELFSSASYKFRFSHDVYKYRVFSKYLLLEVDSALVKWMPQQKTETRLSAIAPGASERFYFALYYLNTFFLILTSIMVVLLLRLQDCFNWTQAESNLIIFFVPMLIGIAEFAVTSYDVSSYFFLLLSLYLYLKLYDTEPVFTMLPIGVFIGLSTMNYESSALSVSLLAAHMLTRYGLSRRVLINIGFMTACFLGTYIALRAVIVEPLHFRFFNPDAGKVLKQINLIGLLFWALFLYLPMAIARSAENRWLIGLFLLFSAPYIITCLKDGVLWEVRLFIPIFLGSLFLSKMDTSKNVIRISQILFRKTIPVLNG